MTQGSMQYGRSDNNADSEFTQLNAVNALLTGFRVNHLIPRGSGRPPWLASAIEAGRGMESGGLTNADTGVIAYGSSTGLWGQGNTPLATGVFGISGRRGTGVFGASGWDSGQPNGDGVHGHVGPNTSTSNAGVIGTGDQRNGCGVIGEANNGLYSFGIWGRSTSGFAGFFNGKVSIVGQLFKSNTAFRIDHPLDPENKYLHHSGVESPDMKTFYDGIVELEEGSAWVQLPEWFGELNREFRYQLTAIGEPAPNLHIAEEISENRFRIAGGAAGMKVSWQVSGIRKDPWAERNRLSVEADKPVEVRGTYLHPEALDQPETRSENYAAEEELRARLVERSARQEELRSLLAERESRGAPGRRSPESKERKKHR